MTRKKEVISDIYKCPIRNIVDRFGDKWSLLVILTIGEKRGPMRFNEMMQSIGEISQKMLTVTLRTLEADGIILRIHYTQIPPKVEYSLTELGYTLLPLLEELNTWAVNNQEVILKTRKKYTTKSSS
ncbi:MAG TPA: helix-turn-helix domain-containing protein [Cyclobacteriaceae bacterium]